MGQWLAWPGWPACVGERLWPGWPPDGKSQSARRAMSACLPRHISLERRPRPGQGCCCRTHDSLPYGTASATSAPGCVPWCCSAITPRVARRTWDEGGGVGEGRGGPTGVKGLTGRAGFGWPSTMPTPTIDRPGQGGLTNLSTENCTYRPHHRNTVLANPGRQADTRIRYYVARQVGWYGSAWRVAGSKAGRQDIGTRPRACAWWLAVLLETGQRQASLTSHAR